MDGTEVRARKMGPERCGYGLAVDHKRIRVAQRLTSAGTAIPLEEAIRHAHHIPFFGGKCKTRNEKKWG